MPFQRGLPDDLGPFRLQRSVDVLDIREEFGHNSDEPALIAVSDGTLLRVHHDHDGIWRIAPLHQGTADFDRTFGVDDRHHTDRVTLTGDHIHWVTYGTKWVSRP